MNKPEFVDLILFENRIENNSTQLVSIKDGYLFRRDGVRLIVGRIEGVKEGFQRDYLITDEIINERGNFVGYKLNQGGNLVFLKNDGKGVELKPVESNVKNNSLKLLEVDSYAESVELDTRKLTKQLLSLQRKVSSDGYDITDVSVLVHEDGAIYLSNMDEYVKIAKVVKEKGNNPMIFNFGLFRDLMIGSKKFGKTIVMEPYEGYFARIRYGNGMCGFLAQKKVI